MDARQLGVEGTLDELQKLLVEKYRVGKSVDDIDADEPFLSVGTGLSSLETVEMLAHLEKQFGVSFDDLENWIDDPPSLRRLARYVVDNSGGA